MKAGNILAALAPTGLAFFVATGAAVRFVPVGAALLVGLVAWVAVGYSFARAMR